MDSVTPLSHTADIGFEVEAGSLEELFELSARGLLEAVGASPRPGAAGEARRLELRKPDLERLMVAWLRELLFPLTTRGQVPSPRVATVRADEEGAAVEADVEWRPLGPEGPEREIKGITYHGLEVARRGDGWHARVVVDV